MYTVAALLVMAIALGGVIAIVNSVLDVLRVNELLRGLPLVGGLVDAGIAVLLVWLLDIQITETFTGAMRETWIQVVIDGLVIYGMIPVKDAVVNAINKGLRA